MLHPSRSLLAQWVQTTARHGAATLAAIACCAALAALPGLDLARPGDVAPDDRWTLGLPVPRFGEATLIVVVAAWLQHWLHGRTGRAPGARARGTSARVFWSILFVLGAFALVGTDIPRRRAVAMAAGSLLLYEAVAVLHGRVARRSRLAASAWALLAASAAALTLVHVIRRDAAPIRTRLPPFAVVPTSATGAMSILLVTLDTTRASDLGAFGSTRGASPALDAFARESVTFLHATAAAPHTHPSIASLLTACPARIHGSVSGAAHLATGVTTLAEHARAHGYRTAGFLDNPWLGEEFGIARGYEHLDARVDLERVERWLDQDDPRPFLLHVHYLHPHGPYERRDNPMGRSLATRGRAARRVGDTVSARAIQRGEVPGRHGFDAGEIDWIHDLYLSEVRALDDDLAELLRAVESRVPAAKLITAIAADHGEEFGERGGLHHSHTLFEELVHVPLMLRVPGVAPSRVDATVGWTDVAPTVLARAGLPPLPGGVGLPLELERPMEARLVISERVRQAGRNLTAVRRGPWKLHVRTRGDSARELGEWSSDPGARASLALFELASDPGETRDVADEHPERVGELLDALLEWERESDERLERMRAEAATADAMTRAVSYRTQANLRSLGY